MNMTTYPIYIKSYLMMQEVYSLDFIPVLFNVVNKSFTK